jgi:hypothetical protein
VLSPFPVFQLRASQTSAELAVPVISISDFSKNFRVIPAILACYLLVLHAGFSFASCDAQKAGEPQVNVAQAGDTTVIDASFMSPVTPEIAWEVLTDYDHMTTFLPDLESSRILEASPERMVIAQRGRLSFGPFSLIVDSEREIRLTQFAKLESRVKSGTFKKGEVTTELVRLNKGTCITYHSKIVPNFRLPFGIGERIARKNVKEQLLAMRAEMLRRHIRAQ